jgi:UDP-N-acetylglucosamine--N-acetylmuramyl-(pentapeptide) pyrophosphoryl-undecaprenol N-acetylglucosamine transferase
MISRSGAIAICEILALQIPNILVPLSAGSRGDQVLNADSFARQGFSVVVATDDLDQKITETVRQVYKNRQTYKDAMAGSSQTSASKVILSLIQNA